MSIARSDDRTPSTRLMLASAAVITAVILIAYLPALDLGFYWDDWGHMEYISRLGTFEYLARAFNPLDPNLLTSYRPLQALLYASTEVVFGFNPVAFHSVNVLLHLVNSLLLFLICSQVVPKRRIALLAGLFYASLPLNSMAIFLINAPDALATMFYLLATWFWLLYLCQGRMRFCALTILSFIFGLLAKEFVITLPATLFLADRLLLRTATRWSVLLRRYVPVGLVSVLYLAFEFFVQPKTVIYNTYRPALGPHMVSNAMVYLNWLNFPWHADPPDASVWVALVLILFIIAVIQTKSAVIVFLGIESIIGILHVLMFQWQIFDTRHLYLAGIVPATLLALLVERGLQFLTNYGRAGFALLTTGFLLIAQVGGVGAFAYDYALKASVERTPFRDISRAHPTIPRDTYLYFLNAPIPTGFLSGMFTLRYGNGITVGGTESGQPANLRQHKNTLLYYFDSTGKAKEVEVKTEMTVKESPSFPVIFDRSIYLTGYELSSQSLARGETLVLFLYWRADKRIDKDYTVFVHLVDSRGQTIQGVDSQPRDGGAPTRFWIPGAPIIDYVILPIDADIPPLQDYALEVGLYDLDTMQRLAILDEHGTPMTDTVLIDQLEIH